MRRQKEKLAPAKLSGRSKIEVHDASPEATVRNLIRHVVENADAFLAGLADPLDFDLVRKGRQDIMVHADVLLRVIRSLTESQPELAAFAFQSLAAVLQRVRLVACHAGKPESAIRHGVKLERHIKGVEMRSSKDLPSEDALMKAISDEIATHGKRPKIEFLAAGVNRRLAEMKEPLTSERTIERRLNPPKAPGVVHPRKIAPH